MNMPDEEFDDIAQSALTKADSVECEIETYREGLRGIIDTFKLALEASLQSSQADG